MLSHEHHRQVYTLPLFASFFWHTLPSGTAADLTGPADLAVRQLPDGSHLVVEPELFARDAIPGDDEVTVLVLPPAFDAACGR